MRKQRRLAHAQATCDAFEDFLGTVNPSAEGAHDVLKAGVRSVLEARPSREQMTTLLRRVTASAEVRENYGLGPLTETQMLAGVTAAGMVLRSSGVADHQSAALFALSNSALNIKILGYMESLRAADAALSETLYAQPPTLAPENQRFAQDTARFVGALVARSE